jgi:DNA modification methylase
MLRARRPKLSNNETFVKVSKTFAAGKPSVSCQSVAQNKKTDECAGAHQIEMMPLRTLKKSPRNSRTHSKRQIEQIANSINRFGFITPIVVDRRNRIVAGHGRAEAAESIGLKAVPIIRVTDLSEIELRAYALADNRIAESAGWNKELLAVEVGELQVALPEIGLDLSITGFEPGELDAVLTDFSDNRMDPADEILEVTQPAIAKQGDLFILGNHRLIVGDARDKDVYVRLLGSEVAEMAFLDPPYNVSIHGHVGGRGRTKHREFAQASGEMTSPQFTQFLKDALGNCARFVNDGAILYVCMDWRHCNELHEAGAGVFDELKNICVWVKHNAGQGSFYRSAHEFVFVYKRGKAPHINTFGLGQNGRGRSNVWNYAGVNSFRAGRMDELAMHPTVKPVAMIADAMKDCSRRGSIILDSFAGSGSTIMAAEQVGRRAYCMEIDPLYADVTIRRWQRATRRDAILQSTGQTFDQLCHTRGAPGEKRTAR